MSVLVFCESSAKSKNGRRDLQAWDRTNGWYTTYKKEKMIVLLSSKQKRTQRKTCQKTILTFAG